MYDGLLTGGMVMVLLVAIGVNFLQIIKGVLARYRITSYVAFKTNMTVTELQRMLESRRLHPSKLSKHASW